MASPRKPRRLFELLEQQQEPLLRPGAAISCFGFKRTRGTLRCALVTKLEIIRKALHCAPENRRPSTLGCFSRFRSTTHVDGFERLSCSGCSSSDELSPVSVLELHYGKAVEEENPSTSSFNSLASEMFEELMVCHYVPQCPETKIKWNQTEKFQFECAKEVKERIWNSKQRTTQMRDWDLSNSRREWIHLQAEEREIGVEIEGAIFEEMRDEAVRDMLSSHRPLERSCF